MKTRVFWTKTWKDDWFQSLSDQGQKLFLYLITNDLIGFSGCYQVSDYSIKSEARIKDTDKTKKELYPKVKFYKDWVYIVNSERYNSFRGSTEIAKEKELKLIPHDVKDSLFKGEGEGGLTHSLPIVHPLTNTNTNTNNINNNNNNKYKNISDIKDEDIKQVAEKYKVSVKYVEGVLEDLENHIEAKGKDKYANKLAALRTWVKNQIKWDSEKGKSVKLKDLEPHQIEDLRLHPEKLSIYTKAGYDTSRINGKN